MSFDGLCSSYASPSAREGLKALWATWRPNCLPASKTWGTSCCCTLAFACPAEPFHVVTFHRKRCCLCLCFWGWTLESCLQDFGVEVTLYFFFFFRLPNCSERVRRVKGEVYKYVLERKGERSDQEYPQIRTLLQFDTREFLNVLSLAFDETDDSSLSADGGPVLPSHQVCLGIEMPEFLNDLTLIHFHLLNPRWLWIRCSM